MSQNILIVFCLLISNSITLDSNDILKAAIAIVPGIVKDTQLKSLLQQFSDIILKESSSSEDCGKCEELSKSIQELLLRGEGRNDIVNYVSDICLNLINIDDDICLGAIKTYSDIVLDNLFKRVYNPSRTCVDFGICQNKVDYIKIEEYASRILADKPDPIEKKIDESSTDIIKALQVTDIHFDSKYLEDSIADCGRPICCRVMPQEGEQCIKAGFFGPEAGNRCDCNIEVVKSFAQELTKLDFDYILITGDNIVGEVWNLDQSDITDAWKTTVDEIVKNIGTERPIFPVIGNHEKNTVDQYHGEETELLEGLTEIFQQWLPEEALSTFRKFGYYSINYKGIRIIVLNCLMCDSFNWYLLSDTSEPKRMFDWFESELASAEKNGELVHIIDHMPIGNGEQNPQCTLRYKVLIERYQNIIQAYISGHTHNDEIKLVREYSTGKPFFVNYICAGLTPESGKNPSFRIFEIDNKTKLLKDFVQYRMDLIESNKDKIPYWKQYYRANEFLNKTNLWDAEGIMKINVEGDYIIHKNTDNEYGKSIAYNEEIVKNEKCDIYFDIYDERNQCKGVVPGIDSNYLYQTMGVLSGNWTE